MNRKINILISIFLLAVVSSCLDESGIHTPGVGEPALSQKFVNTSDNAIPGSLLILVGENSAAVVSSGTCPEALTEACALTEASMKPLFSCKGTDHEKKYRMHRWFTLSFPAEKSVEEVANVFSSLEEVEVVQYNTALERSYGSEPAAWTDTKSAEAEAAPETDPELPFNDPLLKDQWHYINRGDLSVAPTSRVGADINVRDAWELTTGDPNIIVAICDEAVKYDHPDLAANMWINEAEKNGKEGVDDDGNGYVDDIHGYNFLSTYDAATGEGVLMPITWDKNGDRGHGTHVAGTVAAVNNNGIGVSGVAGGDGTPETGIRMMTLQLFSGNASGGIAQRAAAYKYAADMGASIIQCSFGQAGGYVSSDSHFETLYSAEADALDYFMTHYSPANPVAGNFAVFAAGNDAYEMSGYPAAYNKCISVAAFGPDFLPTNYTNYGPGTNICAPGGDIAINSSSATPTRSQVLSTMPKELELGEYGYMQGTSMACPHVSGVIALGLSYARKINRTFTYDEFLGMIYSSVNNIDYYIETCSKEANGIGMDLTPFWHQMGTGAIDTWRLLMQIEGTPCLVVRTGSECKMSIEQYFSPAAANLTYTKVTVSDHARATLGIVGDPYVKYGKLYIHCTKAGSAKISISAIAGGSEIAGIDNVAVGGTEFTREVAVLCREAGVSENGAWL